MINIISNIASGGGTIPKEIEEDSTLTLDASNNTGQTFSWEMLSKPENSNAFISGPISRITKFGPFDTVGVYLVKLVINRDTPTQQIKILSFSVPGQASHLPSPEKPNFEYSGGLIQNGSFEASGILPGWAAYWTVTDIAGMLDEFAGVTRGRCIPTNFQPPHGLYSMVLGDDIGTSIDTISDGDEFSVDQNVDLTNAETITLVLKFINR